MTLGVTQRGEETLAQAQDTLVGMVTLVGIQKTMEEAQGTLVGALGARLEATED